LIAEILAKMDKQTENQKSHSFPYQSPQPSQLAQSPSNPRQPPQRTNNSRNYEGKGMCHPILENSGSIRKEEWRQADSSSKWNTPRAELNKFDGSSTVDWLEDCDFYFDLYNTAEQFKVKTIVPYLIGDAKEWYRYFKMNNHDPP
jgi:hypothetical protein